MTWMLMVGLAHAGAFYNPDPGVAGVGAGMTGVVWADDLSAVGKNPAALTRIEGGSARLEFALVHAGVRFEPADRDHGDGPQSFDTVRNEAGPYPIPHVGVAHDFGTERFTFALSFRTPYAPLLSYPDDGAQRYHLRRSWLVQTSLGPSVAVQLPGGLSVGAGLFWSTLHAEYEITLSRLNGVDQEGTDIGVSFAATDPFALTGNLGVLWERPRFAVAASVQPPVDFRQSGQLTVDFSENELYDRDEPFITEPTISDDDVSTGIRTPLIVRGGVGVRPHDAVLIELSGAYERWRVVDSLVITDVDLTIPTREGLDDVVVSDDIALPMGFQDTWSVRLGATGRVHERVLVRGGGFYESSAIPEATLGVMTPDGRKLGYGVGLQVQATTHLFVDVGWSQAFMGTRQLSDSQVYAVEVNTGTGAITQDAVVGNGTFSARTDIGAVGVDWRW